MGNLRQQPRVEINHVITYTYNRPGKQSSSALQGRLINLSTSGVLIETKEPIRKKSLILGNNSDTVPRMVIGDAVLTSEADTHGIYKTGIKFTDTPKNAKEFIISIVKPDEAGGKTNKTVILSSSGYHLPHFDNDSIQQILDETATTALNIDIGDLLLDDEEHAPEFDVLKDIAIVLEESEKGSNDAKPVNSLSIGTAPSETSVETQNRAAVSKSFLFYFNAACLFLICLVLIPTLSTGVHIEPPFLSQESSSSSTAAIPDSVEKPKLTTLIQNSVSGKFVYDRVKGEEFVITGFISASQSTSPDEIMVTGRLFNQNSLLLAKNQAAPEEQVFLMNKHQAFKKIKSQQKIFPFHIAFSKPAENISLFSIDIE